jgi:hypothetical protein
MPGYEVNLLYIAGLLALAIGGAGAYSVDRMRGGDLLSGHDDGGTGTGRPRERAPAAHSRP